MMSARNSQFLCSRVMLCSSGQNRRIPFCDGILEIADGAGTAGSGR